LTSTGAVPRDAFFEPEPASREALLRVHGVRYLDRLEAMTSSPDLGYYEIEAPVSRQVLDAFYAMAGGSIASARVALDHGYGGNVGGGFHHAFADHGEGFCAIHDVAVAIRALQHEGRLERAAIVDLDVHQGNGSAVLFARDPSVYTFSMHQENNYPVKQVSSLDIGLDDGTEDAEYLERLDAALPGVLDGHRPQLVAYIAGADPYEHDQLGGLRLTRAGLAQRDERVYAACRARGIPVFTTLAGGYSRNFGDVVAIQGETLRLGLQNLR
jgi:acetoin utilization deacetylase AcuC-like enzyme